MSKVKGKVLSNRYTWVRGIVFKNSEVAHSFATQGLSFTFRTFFLCHLEVKGQSHGATWLVLMGSSISGKNSVVVGNLAKQGLSFTFHAFHLSDLEVEGQSHSVTKSVLMGSRHCFQKFRSCTQFRDTRAKFHLSRLFALWPWGQRSKSPCDLIGIDGCQYRRQKFRSCTQFSEARAKFYFSRL